MRGWVRQFIFLQVEFWTNNGSNDHQELKKSIKILPYSLSKIEKIITGLEKYFTYNVTVLCYTAQGDGPKSLPIQFRTLQDGNFVTFRLLHIVTIKFTTIYSSRRC